MQDVYKPLSGIRVIDLSAVISGPFCTMMLADQGADVIKVERPGVGDMTRHLMTSRNGISSLFLNLNRNKRSIALDLASEQGRTVMYKLLATADVLVENFRPGTLDRLKLGYEQIKTLNPKLIYVSINGFGSRGPCAKEPAYDVMMQAKSGMIAQQVHPDSGEKDLIRTSVCDKVASLTAAQAISAALFSRERGGTGRHIEISMLDAAIAFYWPDGMMNCTFVGEGVDVQRPIAETNRVVKTRDGHLVLSITDQRDAEGLGRALDRPSLLDDERFRTARDRIKNTGAWEATVQEQFLLWKTQAIAARLKAEGVPYGVVNNPADVRLDTQVIASELLLESEHPVGGRIIQSRQPAVLNGEPQKTLGTGAPSLGEHSEEILREAGFTDQDLHELSVPR